MADLEDRRVEADFITDGAIAAKIQNHVWVSAIPDLVFHIDLLVADPPVLGARLLFDCMPLGELFGPAVNGRRVAFTENVFYRFAGAKIESVWSVIDQAAIRTQLQRGA